MCALVAIGTAHAVEDGVPITAIGVMNFGAGMLPPASELPSVALRYASYRSTDLRDNSGNESSNKVDFTVNSASVALIKMTEIDLFGGKYGYSAVIPVMDIKNQLTIPNVTTISEGKTDLGDIVITPVIVAWTPSPELSTNASLQLQLPTGSFKRANNANSIANTGANHYTVSPSFAFTYITPSGFEVSSNIQVNFHTENTTTKYTSGNEFQHEFAFGKHLGPWTIGLGGYHYQQISDDTGTGATNGPNRSRVSALGPAVHFFDPAPGKPVIWAHLYKEFNAVNRTQGTLFAINVSWSF